MDGKQAQEQEKINMKAMSNPVYLKFTGAVGVVDGYKVVPVPDRVVSPGRVLRLGFLGTQYEFRAGEEKLVPKAAAMAWEQLNLNTWEDKVVFEIREAKMVAAEAAPDMDAIRAKVRAELEAEKEAALAEQKEKYEAEIAKLASSGGKKGK